MTKHPLTDEMCWQIADDSDVNAFDSLTTKIATSK